MEPKRPESVLVVVHTHAGEVLLLKRADRPDFWQSVTGSLQPGETPLDAARRELAEETGLAADGLVDCQRRRRFFIPPDWRGRFAPGVTHNLEHEFRLELPEAAAVRPNPDEHTEARWLGRDDALARAASWTNRAAIRALPVAPGDAIVVLVHGLWIGPGSMRLLARRLRAAGWRTHVFAYRSTREPPARAAWTLAERVERLDAPVVHLVGHSLGGLVLAHMLDSYRPARIGRAVLLGSPMRGCAAARGMARWHLGWTLGAAREHGLDSGAPAWPRDVPVAVIAGTRACGPGRLVARLRRPHDGTVALRETFVRGASRANVPTTHLGLLASRRAAAATAAFLRESRFAGVPGKPRHWL